jgi:hypothetical protein
MHVSKRRIRELMKTRNLQIQRKGKYRIKEEIAKYCRIEKMTKCNNNVKFEKLAYLLVIIWFFINVIGEISADFQIKQRC